MTISRPGDIFVTLSKASFSGIWEQLLNPR